MGVLGYVAIVLFGALFGCFRVIWGFKLRDWGILGGFVCFGCLMGWAFACFGWVIGFWMLSGCFSLLLAFWV